MAEKKVAVRPQVTVEKKIPIPPKVEKGVPIPVKKEVKVKAKKRSAKKVQKRKVKRIVRRAKRNVKRKATRLNPEVKAIIKRLQLEIRVREKQISILEKF